MVQYENPVTTPAPGQTLANSQAPMLADFQYLKAFGNKDHNFSSDSTVSSDGYHKLIHMMQQATPSVIANTGQLWANASNVPNAGGTQLWYEDTFGIATQLTSAAGANPAAQGHTFLPGGLILNWGSASVNSAGSLTTINFEKTFSSSPFSVVIGCRPSSATASPSANNVYITSVSAGSFTVSNSSSGTLTSIYFMAIGTF